MTRSHLIQHLLHQARGNGFELRRWFRTDAAVPWPGGDAALLWLCQGARVNLLLFSHSFAETFFGGPERLRHVQPATAFERTAPNGVTRLVQRRAFPRSARYDQVWRYHLQRMATAPEPLRYAQRFLVSAEMLQRASLPQPTAQPAALVPELHLFAPEVHYDDELLIREE